MKLFATLLVLAAVAFAAPSITGHVEGVYHGTPATDDVVDSNAYNDTHMYSSAFAINGDYWTADDWTPDSGYDLAEVWFWTVTTGSNPSSADFYFWDDATDAGPGNELYMETVSPDYASTSITFAGYPVYIMENPVSYHVNEGETYWLTAQASGTLFTLMDDEVVDTECYRIVTAGGDWVAGSTQGEDPTDMFRVIDGTEDLSPSSWGEIKALY